jgi:hypothetical protein
MNKTSQLLCAHSGLLFAVLLGVGFFGIVGWLPPQDPSISSTDLAQLFREDASRIRIGMTMMAFGSVFWWSFAAAIAIQMKRIEGDSHPLTYVQMASASGGVMAVLFPAYFWLAMVYRPEGPSPETMQLLNDLGWMTFIGMYPPGFLQNVALGLCILSSKNVQQIFPRWLGYVNLWFAVGFMPGALLPFFKTGPFAWNGVIGFWLVATVFFGWIVLMWWATVRAIRQQETLQGS